MIVTYHKCATTTLSMKCRVYMSYFFVIRFDGFFGGKVTKHMRFTDRLNLRPYMSNKQVGMPNTITK